MKKARGRRRRLNGAPPRSRVRKAGTVLKSFREEGIAYFFSRRLIPALFAQVVSILCFCRLLPCRKIEQRSLRSLTHNEKLWHIGVVLTLVVLNAGYKALCLYRHMVSEPFAITTVMSFPLMVLYPYTLSLKIQHIMYGLPLAPAHNSVWKLYRMLEKETGRKVTPFDDTAVVLMMGIVACLCGPLPVIMTVITFCIPAVPVSVFYITDQAGIPTLINLPKIYWQLMLLPLQLADIAIPAMILFYYASISYIGVAVSNDCIKNMIWIQENESGRKKMEAMEKLMIALQLYNRIYSAWYRQMLPANFFSVCAAITMLAYLCLGPVALPLYVRVMLLVIAFCLSTGFFLFLKQVSDMVRKCEELRSANTSGGVPKHKFMTAAHPQASLVGYYKRMKAVQALKFEIGRFAEISVDSAVSMLEEIINQTLFLLSL